MLGIVKISGVFAAALVLVRLLAAVELDRLVLSVNKEITNLRIEECHGSLVLDIQNNTSAHTNFMFHSKYRFSFFQERSGSASFAVSVFCVQLSRSRRRTRQSFVFTNTTQLRMECSF